MGAWDVGFDDEMLFIVVLQDLGMQGLLWVREFCEETKVWGISFSFFLMFINAGKVELEYTQQERNRVGKWFPAYRFSFRNVFNLKIECRMSENCYRSMSE